jgi:ThiF family
LPDISTVASAALDRFVLDLVEAGFETENGFSWRGPLDPSLSDLTTATEMRIRIENGWPYRSPHVYVDGMRPSAHLNGTALCLWRVGDDSLAWLRLSDLRERIGQWAERYRTHATAEDPRLDAHLAFENVNLGLLATLDISKVRWGGGGTGLLKSKKADDEGLVEIGAEGDERVRWYGQATVRIPPRDLQAFREALSPAQRRNLTRELHRVGAAGGLAYLILIWGTPVGEPNVLALRLTRNEVGEVAAEAIEVARMDETVLIKRAGGDAPNLRTKSAVVFGQGAIGSNVSLLLARSGVGKLVCVDLERLRPGDVVRHAASRFYVGWRKVWAVWAVCRKQAPWCEVRPVKEAPWDPTRLLTLAVGADLVIDAVGEASFTEQLDRLAADAPITAPILAVSLYRGGSVARVRLRQGTGVAINERTPANGFVEIPAGPVEPSEWETGCASPVNNAPPVSVVSAAALAARMAIEVLAGREAGSFDAVEVYRPLDAAPLDRLGYQRFG